MTNLNGIQHKPFTVWEWHSEEELEQILNERDPADAPNCPYIIPQSDKLGKLIWITGPPGAGKSTTAQIMGRNHGYVFYSVDCFVFELVNPFIDLNVENPTLAQKLQNPLKVSTFHSTVVQIHMNGKCIRHNGLILMHKYYGKWQT